MVDIITKNKGPRREDVVAKNLIGNNWSTISRLADQISDGGFTRSRNTLAKSKELPKPDNLNIHLLGAVSKKTEPQPIVQISRNGRVLALDLSTGKQLEYLGKIIYQGENRYFCLASEKNSPYATVSEEIENALVDLDGVIIESDEIQALFIEALQARLFTNTSKDPLLNK